MVLRTKVSSPKKDDEVEVKKVTTIKAIDHETIKYIAAGEKISDIETAVRELIENSIDAKAKYIEIRLVKFGADSIEVEDDGIGIEEEDFNSIGARYHTSKIQDFNKLSESLETFGFRGEALSCLIKIANVTITTKSQNSPTGTKLHLSNNGSITSKEPVARGNGTTVIVKNLFHSLPVRRRELEMTAKKQYDKVVNMIHEQVLARPHVKFSLYKKISTKKIQDFNHGGTTLEGVIISIFGIKILETLIAIKQIGLKDMLLVNVGNNRNSISSGNNGACSNSQAPKIVTAADLLADTEAFNKRSTRSSQIDPTMIIENCNVNRKLRAVKLEQSIAPDRGFFKPQRRCKYKRDKPLYTIYGYISRLGAGRHSSDYQYIYINNKPCDVPKLSRLINELYREYSSTNQYPFYILFIQVQPFAADFNVPKKREVILQDEDKLFQLVRDSLEEMFAPSVPAIKKACSSAHIPIVVRKETESERKDGGSDAGVVQEETIAPSVLATEKACSQAFGEARSSAKEPIVVRNETVSEKEKEDHNGTAVQSEVVNCNPTSTDKLVDKLIEESSKEKEDVLVDTVDTAMETNLQTNLESSQYFEKSAQIDANSNEKLPITKEICPGKDISESSTCDLNPPMQISGSEISPLKEKDLFEEEDFSGCQFSQVESKTLNGKLQVKLEHLEDFNQAFRREYYQRQIKNDSRQFSYAIHPKFNSVAEQELQLNLDKTSFTSMEIMGQFNKGFIITRLNKHLFIIDQHATDERANYEDQLNKCPLEKQKMVWPKPLYLTRLQENKVMENQDIFEKHGLEFQIKHDKPDGLRVLLSSTLICKGQGLDVHLGKEDVEELLDVITNSPALLANYTLTKVKNVAATRACRKSVMIGEPLSWQQMTHIVHKMSDLQNPWICAHGRPTIRHLLDIDYEVW